MRIFNLLALIAAMASTLMADPHINGVMTANAGTKLAGYWKPSARREVRTCAVSNGDIFTA